jgi:hypothetical protein
MRQGVGAPAIDQHGAGAAGTQVTALLGAIELQPFVQNIEQRGGRRHRQAMPGTVDLQGHVELMLEDVSHRPSRIVADGTRIRATL